MGKRAASPTPPENNEDDDRFVLRADITSFTTYLSPDKTFYLTPKAKEIAPITGKKLPAIASKVVKNRKVHLTYRQNGYLLQKSELFQLSTEVKTCLKFSISHRICKKEC